MSDRHFDQLATRFAEKIYGGAKGAIRLAVLQADLTESLPARPLRVLDIGAGLGHMSLWLAQQGHDVTLAEPAAPMLEGARQRFADAGQNGTFIQAPWQELLGQLTEPYDLVLCHAVLEWLAEPHAILPVLHQLTARDGWLSLAFYNRDALIYRNLLKGHFRKMRKNDMAGEKQSLTPQQPLDPRELATALEGLWQVETQSGVRVFHDYMPVEFQARAELQALVEMELAHRRHPAFAGLGRYLHWVCRPVCTASSGEQHVSPFRLSCLEPRAGGLPEPEPLYPECTADAARSGPDSQHPGLERLPCAATGLRALSKLGLAQWPPAGRHGLG